MNKQSESYRELCTEFYVLDNPHAPLDALRYYLACAAEANGSVLEPMCGAGRFLIPLIEEGYDVTGFDNSPHMLEVCRNKCFEKKINPQLVEASFETFSSNISYKLIFIPSASFCLLVDLVDVQQALRKIFECLANNGKFIFEIETLKAVREPQGIWSGRWIKKDDGSLFLHNRIFHFDTVTNIETRLCRKELWENNRIVQTEVEEFRLHLYVHNELDEILEGIGFKIKNKFIPYTRTQADENAQMILYECVK